MAKKARAQEADGEGIMITAAKRLGGAAGTIASSVRITLDAESAPAPPTARRAGKLVAKQRSRLPRREKKARQKANTTAKSPSRP
jgi:hypothetical protein